MPIISPDEHDIRALVTLAIDREGHVHRVHDRGLEIDVIAFSQVQAREMSAHCGHVNHGFDTILDFFPRDNSIFFSVWTSTIQVFFRAHAFPRPIRGVLADIPRVLARGLIYTPEILAIERDVPMAGDVHVEKPAATIARGKQETIVTLGIVGEANIILAIVHERSTLIDEK